MATSNYRNQSRNRGRYGHEKGNQNIPAEGKIFPLLRTQIEYYFSHENLVRDKFIKSFLCHPDHPGSIPTQVICNFPRVREAFALATMGPDVPSDLAPVADPNFVIHALSSSSEIMISEDKLWLSPVNFDLQLYSTSYDPVYSDPPFNGNNESRQGHNYQNGNEQTTFPMAAPGAFPNHSFNPMSQYSHSHLPRERNTVIVREVPQTASEDQILDAFSFNGIQPKQAKRAQLDTWYVDFGSEQEAIEALHFTKGRTICGKPIRGGLKSTPPTDFGPNHGHYRPNNTTMNFQQNNSFVPIYNGSPSKTEHQPKLVGHVAPYGYTPDMGVPMKQPMVLFGYNSEEPNQGRSYPSGGGNRSDSPSLKPGQYYPAGTNSSPRKKKPFSKNKNKNNKGKYGGYNAHSDASDAHDEDGNFSPTRKEPRAYSNSSPKQYHRKQQRGDNNGNAKLADRQHKSNHTKGTGINEAKEEEDFPTLSGAAPTAPVSKQKERPAYAEALRKKSGFKGKGAKRDLVSPVAVEDIEKGVHDLAFVEFGEDDNSSSYGW
jgi:hypothetical protein